MKKSLRIVALLLVLTMSLSMMCTAADVGLQYIFSETDASAENDLFEYNSSKVTGALDPSDLVETKGTHYYAGNGNFSRFSSAHVCRTGASGEEPVCYDESGTPYYVQAEHSILEGRNLYVNDYYMNGRHVEGKCYARWDYIQQFVLADTDTGAVTTTYCADQVTSTQDGYYYNIENVEDADYYTDAQARKIRTIALNGYWGDSNALSGLGSLAAMKDKLRASGKFTEDELARLTDGIAMTATQYAIWEYSNLSRGDKRISAYYTSEAGDILGVPEEQKASVDLIFKVYHYLIGLDPTDTDNTTADTVITEENFLTTLGVVAKEKITDHANNLDENQDNDAYITDLTFTMAVLPKAGNGDDLVAVVYGADSSEIARGRIAGTIQSGEIQLKTDGNGTYTFENLEMVEGTQNLSITLEGTQQLERGVYLYTSEVRNGKSSQTLVGIAEGAHQVAAELDWDVKFSVQEEGPERIINIYKTGSTIPLEGIAFDFYYVASRTDYLTGKVDLPAAKNHLIPDVADYTIITDEKGEGTFNLTENSMPDGVYLVVEREHPVITAPVDPFYVIMPATSADGTHLEYVVNVYPKNTVDGNVDIEKDVITVGNDSSDVTATAPHTWIIGTSIPADIGNSKYFIISDILDNRLDYVGNIRVRVENRSGTVVAVTLMEGQDYTVNVNDVDSLSEGNPSDSFTVSLTRAGMSRVESAVAGGITHIRVYFDAKINGNASVGEDIPNQAELDYKNSVGVNFHVESDEPEVYTGGVCLEKVDAADPGKKLEGAVFQVYRIATAAEINDESVTTTKIGDMAADMVLVSFYNNSHLSGDQVTEVTSDANGSFGVYGMAYGTYYLVETQAPAGYNLSSAPIEVTINETSHQAEYIIKVTNNAGATLPETGGMGTTIFYIAGGLMVALAVVLLVTKKRMSE